MLQFLVNKQYLIMKKISLILIMAGMIWTVQTANAQTQDTTKNNIEIKKKVKKGAHGRTVTKIKMEGTGTPDAIKGAAEGAVTGHLPTPAPVAVTPPVVVTPPPPPVIEPAAPVVVVVHDTVKTPAPPHTSTTQVTTTTETKPAVTASTTVHKTTTYKKPAHVYHKTYVKAAVTPATKTTTTTTVKKTE
jgi:hypothetical protein